MASGVILDHAFFQTWWQGIVRWHEQMHHFHQFEGFVTGEFQIDHFAADFDLPSVILHLVPGFSWSLVPI